MADYLDENLFEDYYYKCCIATELIEAKELIVLKVPTANNI